MTSVKKFDYQKEIKKEIVDSLKDGSIITISTITLFYLLKTILKVSPPSASLNPNDMLKLTGGICVGTLVKDYLVYKKYIDE